MFIVLSHNCGKDTEYCKNIPARFGVWLAEILRSAILGWASEHFESDTRYLTEVFLHNSVDLITIPVAPVCTERCKFVRAVLSTSLAWPAVAGCSRAEIFSQLSSNKFTPLCIREFLKKKDLHRRLVARTVPVGGRGDETPEHGFVVPPAVGAVAALGVAADVHRIAPRVLS